MGWQYAMFDLPPCPKCKCCPSAELVNRGIDGVEIKCRDYTVFAGGGDDTEDQYHRARRLWVEKVYDLMQRLEYQPAWD